MEFKGGNIQCRNIKNVASKCLNYVPDKIQFESAGNPPGSSLGPDLYRSQSSTWLKEYYYLRRPIIGLPMILVVPTAIETISPTWLALTGTFTSGSNVLYMYHENGISRVVGL